MVTLLMTGSLETWSLSSPLNGTFVSPPQIHTQVVNTSTVYVGSSPTSQSNKVVRDIGPLSSGEVHNEFIDVVSFRNSDSSDLILSMSEREGTVLTADPVRALRVQVFECEIPWQQFEGTCKETGGKAVTLSTLVSDLRENPLTLNVSAIDSETRLHLRIQFSLPSAVRQWYTDVTFEPITQAHSTLVFEWRLQ